MDIPAPADTLVLICSCAATADRRDACRETWLREYLHPVPEGLRYVFLVGRPGQETTLLGDTLYLDCPDTYLGLPRKIHLAIQTALRLWNFQWLFKCDDDTLAVLHRVEHYARSGEYMGRRVLPNAGAANWHQTVVPTKEKVAPFDYHSANALAEPPSPGIGWAGGGVGYFLSRRACQLVAAEPLRHVNKALYEDRMVGEIMASHGIYLHGRHATLRPFGEGSIYGATSLHPLGPDAMRETYYRLLRAGEFSST